ncbi:MAG: CDP-alcohol phosphatidyltransferase family protein [Alphaproteobacteria bacterium]|nr:CDP-alcohol phosphatidyltransferase family protein [Alphaproteobacteria bacterium]
MLENTPNLITLARICAVPLLIWLILADQLATAFWVFVAAGVSDALDGYIAKRFNLVTRLGAFMDPIADKALLVAAFITLGHAGHIESWLVILVVFRDVLIIGGVVLYYILGRHVEMNPLLISKANTLMQIVLVSTVLAEIGIGFPETDYIPILSYIVAITTVASGGAYLYQGIFGVRVSPRWPLDQWINRTSQQRAAPRAKSNQ